MSNTSEDEQKKQQEYRELLKLKQGLIEESELIPESGYEKMPELHGFAKAKNWAYHNRGFIIVGVLAAVLLTFLIVQTVTREKEDLYVLVISTTNQSGLYLKTADIETALERYCPDFDGNGYVHVGVNFIDIAKENGMSEYTDAQQYKFMSELFTGDSQMYIADEGLMDELYTAADGEIEFFQDWSEKYPELLFNKGGGIRLNSTGLKDEARWQSCPDMVGVYVREVFENMTGNSGDASERRERAETVLRNIAEGNIVNPDTE